jgi:hypothetical protein
MSAEVSSDRAFPQKRRLDLYFHVNEPVAGVLEIVAERFSYVADVAGMKVCSPPPARC